MSDHAADGHSGPHHSADYYYKTYAVLLVLLVASVIGPFIGDATGIQAITLITAFGIAFVKAGLVIRNFMHLTVEKAFVHYFLITSLAFMLLFFFAVSPDVQNHEGTRWKNLAAEAEIERVEAEYANGGGHHGAHGDSHGEPHGDDAHGEKKGDDHGGDHH